MSTDVILGYRWRVKVAQFLYKERRMADFLEENPQKGGTTKEDKGGAEHPLKISSNEGGQGGQTAPLPLFLSDAEIQNQANRYAWRKGVPSTVNNLFRTPRDTPEFPSVFQNTPKTGTTKPLPFTYKAFQRVRTEAHVAPPSISIPEPTEEPAYAPTTP